MKNITVRIAPEIENMLKELDMKPTPAATTALEVFTWLRRATIHELCARFTREEIIALADSFNGLMPTWQLMVNPSVLVAHTEDAEKYQYSASMHGADPVALLKKLKELTSAQATILQLELVNFWNRPLESSTNDFENLFKILVPIESPREKPTHFRDKPL